jgi:membrane protease subunit (stomatin/prohibitin family)
MGLMRRGPGLVRTVGRTAAIVGTAGAVSHHQQEKYAAKDEAQYEQQQAAAAPPQAAAAAPAEPDLNTELTQLAQLHSQGILTDEEFAAKKAQLLGI